MLEKLQKRTPAIKGIVSQINYQVLSKLEFEGVVSKINDIWGLRSISRNDIKKFIVKQNILKEDHIDSGGNDSFEIYYLPDSNIDFFDIASTRSRSSYFSHYSAIYIHNLTLQIPKQIYLTLERKKLDLNSNSLKQESIDKVFSKPPRITSNKRNYKNFDINFINGQCQNLLGIIKFREKYYVSNLERTLIDISVRPFYSGGVTQVLEAFIKAKDRMNPERLIQYYTESYYTYPYHQVIGFYLEKAGYDKKIYKKFLNFDNSNYDFYLTYNILHKEYSKKWHLYYPKGL